MKTVGDRIGSIVLRDRLGAGGMGEVYSGFDEKLGREVAVKTVPIHRLDDEAARRLRREAQVLSGLDHPSICRIHDLIEEPEPGGGSYLVLEYIRGVTLRQEMARRAAAGQDTTFRECLDWLIQIAEGIAAAHRSGIVHRDIKLDNVMLRRDGRLAILDFGLARPDDAVPIERAEATARGAPTPATSSTAASATAEAAHLTHLGQTLGTLTSMSPEQARGEPASFPSDVYSFGLLLQELATGRPPYPEGLDPEHLRIKAMDGDTVPPDGAPRALVERLGRLLALEPSARPSMADVVHSLRTLQARPAKVRRRIAWAALLGLLLLGAWKYTADLQTERNRAVAAQAESDLRRQEAEAVVDFLGSLFSESDPRETLGEEVTATQLLERGAERVESELETQPLVRARLMETIAQASRELGAFDRTERLYREALEVRREAQGPDHQDTLRTQVDYGDLLTQLGRFDEARPLLEAGVTAWRDRFDDEALADALNRLGALHLTQGRFGPARAAFEESLALRRALSPAAGPRAAALLNNLAVVDRAEGNLESATRLDREALAIRRRVLDAGHPEIATSLNNLSIDRYLAGDYAGAASHLEEALTLWEGTLGDEHPAVATALSNLGELAAILGEPDLAERRFRRALTIWERALGPEHPDLAYATHGLGRLARDRGDRNEARRLLERTLQLRTPHLADDHPERVAVLDDLASLDS